MGCSSMSILLPLLLLTFSSIIIDSRVAEARLLPKSVLPLPSAVELPSLPVPLPSVPAVPLPSLPLPAVPLPDVPVPSLSLPNVPVPALAIPKLTAEGIKVIP
ncbi:hypothetical protein PHAVU_006G202700 [Phaseolus vulgaris]|uniref:Uncharacterized protein n=1 Tax=Phaseolus vulgaris TaxID=3885 RepID=V7BTJ4_PHAVU|nr:hypothetical protein PHAVU_006G202700g [Phaseolus vulgaris]ESW20365.1 hypothetical protein PHAVU_006G202700g [Phaseolus vulgaris]